VTIRLLINPETPVNIRTAPEFHIIASSLKATEENFYYQTCIGKKKVEQYMTQEKQYTTLIVK